jgi:E3 ubiquitin-protein ligase DOA10
VCRICMCKETKSMPFVHLGCKCKGSMAVVHKVGSDFLFLTETLF